MTTGPGNPFSSAFEAGMRALILLVAAYPRALDVDRLVTFDYLAVHSGDAGGPASLHAPVPLRSGELLVRRGLIERGVLLMVSRELIVRQFTATGVTYAATDNAAPFLELLVAEYTTELRNRTEWVVSQFGGLSDAALRQRTARLFQLGTVEFEGQRPPGMLLG